MSGVFIIIGLVFMHVCLAYLLCSLNLIVPCTYSLSKLINSYSVKEKRVNIDV